MFRPGTPWRRFYMLHNAEPFNASGGASLMGDKMRRGEEVLALMRRNPRAGVQVSDIAGWDVLRWNGACATIHDGEFSTDPPSGEAGHARVEWRSLGVEVRQAFEANSSFGEIYEARRRSFVQGDHDRSRDRRVRTERQAPRRRDRAPRSKGHRPPEADEDSVSEEIKDETPAAPMV
jgi:hypothetical protein